MLVHTLYPTTRCCCTTKPVACLNYAECMFVGGELCGEIQIVYVTPLCTFKAEIEREGGEGMELL